jgi:hypothetical protein
MWDCGGLRQTIVKKGLTARYAKMSPKVAGDVNASQPLFQIERSRCGVSSVHRLEVPAPLSRIVQRR